MEIIVAAIGGAGLIIAAVITRGQRKQSQQLGRIEVNTNSRLTEALDAVERLERLLTEEKEKP